MHLLILIGSAAFVGAIAIIRTGPQPSSQRRLFVSSLVSLVGCLAPVYVLELSADLIARIVATELVALGFVRWLLTMVRLMSTPSRMRTDRDSEGQR